MTPDLPYNFPAHENFHNIWLETQAINVSISKVLLLLVHPFTRYSPKHSRAKKIAAKLLHNFWPTQTIANYVVRKKCFIFYRSYEGKKEGFFALDFFFRIFRTFRATVSDLPFSVSRQDLLSWYMLSFRPNVRSINLITATITAIFTSNRAQIYYILYIPCLCTGSMVYRESSLAKKAIRHILNVINDWYYDNGLLCTHSAWYKYPGFLKSGHVINQNEWKKNRKHLFSISTSN